MIVIKIKEFSTFTSVRIFEGGSHPRVRSASSRGHFNRILREEIAHFGKNNVRIEKVWLSRKTGVYLYYDNHTTRKNHRPKHRVGWRRLPNRSRYNRKRPIRNWTDEMGMATCGSLCLNGQPRPRLAFKGTQLGFRKRGRLMCPITIILFAIICGILI